MAKDCVTKFNRYQVLPDGFDKYIFRLETDPVEHTFENGTETKTEIEVNVFISGKMHFASAAQAEQWIADENNFATLLNQLQEAEKEAQLEELRARRAVECFPYADRGECWYRTLTADQKEEFFSWYQAWCDVTETLVVPDKPTWLK